MGADKWMQRGELKDHTHAHTHSHTHTHSLTHTHTQTHTRGGGDEDAQQVLGCGIGSKSGLVIRGLVGREENYTLIRHMTHCTVTGMEKNYTGIRHIVQWKDLPSVGIRSRGMEVEGLRSLRAGHNGSRRYICAKSRRTQYLLNLHGQKHKHINQCTRQFVLSI
jgi:hypothetical protein